ncbi:MAG: hypothetical protein IKA71_05610 [Lentisphaeria bacterium]|nr:hypothetical protein [Lentisphaeria bacterium]
MKKIIIGIIAGAAVLILLAGISGLAAAYIAPPKVKIPVPEMRLPSSLRPGDIITAEVTVALPGNVRVTGGEIKGENITALPLHYRCTGWLWNRRRWQISGQFRVLTEGKISGLKLEFTTRTIFSSRINERYEVELPELTAILPAADLTAELPLADELTGPEEKNSPFSRHWWWLLIPLAAVIYFLSRRLYRKKRALSPGEAALSEIDRLGRKVRKSELPPEKAFGMLCDVVRNYLEARFQLPAPRCTTQEFLHKFQLPADFPESEQAFLKRLLTAADLIKFAGMRTGEVVFFQAAENAGKLIRITAENKEKK